jgi:hypothetical protein
VLRVVGSLASFPVHPFLVNNNKIPLRTYRHPALISIMKDIGESHLICGSTILAGTDQPSVDDAYIPVVAHLEVFESLRSGRLRNMR